MRKLIILGFVAGLIAAALGLGGGVMYNPLLISLNISPKVSSATGMHLIRYS